MSEEELNQMSNNELIGIIKAQKFEIEQLENIRKEIKKEIKKYAYTDNYGDTVVLAKYIEDILNKGDNK